MQVISGDGNGRLPATKMSETGGIPGGLVSNSIQPAGLTVFAVFSCPFNFNPIALESGGLSRLPPNEKAP